MPEEKSALENKHIELHNAILEMNNNITALDNLICRIQGTTSEDTKESEYVTPPLIEVLDTSPIQIRSTNSIINNRIDDLHNLLF